MHQDNASIIKLVKNECQSTYKRHRNFAMRIFYAKDHVGTKKILIQCYTTKEILADYMSKALVGPGLKRDHQRIMNATSLQ